MDEPVTITVKKPVWSTRIVALDGHGYVIHNYADGTNSGPLPIYTGPPYPFALLSQA